MEGPEAETGPRTLQEAAGLVLVGAADQAREFLAAWTAEHPDDVDGWFLSTMAAADLAEQLPAVTELRRLAPGLGFAHLVAFAALREAGRLNDALDALERAHALTPELGVRRARGSAVEPLGCPDLPSPLAAPAPVSAEVLQRRIVAGCAGDDLDRVALDARWWTQLAPENPRAWRMLALVNLALGRDDRASNAARHLLDLTPQDPAAQQLVVETQTGLVVAPPQPGPAPDPEQVDACWSRAQQAGTDDDHETALRELIALAPHVRDGYADLSLLLARAGDLTGALEIAEAGARQARRTAAPDGWLPPPRWTAAVVARCDRAWPDPDAEGDWAALIAPARTWVQLDPAAVAPLVLVREACRRLDRPAEAAEALRRARAIEPRDRTVRRMARAERWDDRLDALARIDAAGDYYHPGPSVRLAIWLVLCLLSTLLLALLDDPPAKPLAIALMTMPTVGAVLMYRARPDDGTLRGFLRALTPLVRIGSVAALAVTALVWLVGLAGAV